MSEGIRVALEHHGDTDPIPVKLEIFDQHLVRVHESWLTASASEGFVLKPGVYGVKASGPSGASAQRIVKVEPNEMTDCSVPLHEVSPHESHEWAYLTKRMDAPGEHLLGDSLYEGAWMKLWERTGSGRWRVIAPPSDPPERMEDGLSYDFQAPGYSGYALQVGGPKIPWKLAMLPPSQRLMLLLRPSAAPKRVHPLDVVVSGDNWSAESLLALMQRGELRKASELDRESQFAEMLLYAKYSDPVAAAVGGYFLLKTNDLARLHDWARNLADGFDWMSDGAVIHAWQILGEARSDTAARGGPPAAARARLLEAAGRGVPIYTEGLRLLRDGLLLLDRAAQGGDHQVAEAMASVGAYAEAADWSASVTTFTGNSPTQPSAKPRRGKPRGKAPFLYVYDVPIPEAIRKGVLEVGDELVSGGLESTRARVAEDGHLTLDDGRSFKSLGALQSAVKGTTSGAWFDWKQEKTGAYVGSLLSDLPRDE
ncbi:MAG TPA: hypothetical protein VMV46_07115 [Thermoanaerobaculia bacterium]|nr:hypothetical protein [Thermoanaerobaculia bacterium]